MALIGVTAALVAAAPAHANHQYDSTVRCANKTVRGVKLVTRSAEAAVFTKRKRTSGAYFNYVSYACMFRRGSIERLQRSDVTRSRLLAQLAGRYLGYRQAFAITEFGTWSGVVVLDMATGENKLETPAADTNVIDLVVKRNGSAAWIDVAQESSGTYVAKADVTTGGRPQLVESGDGIEGGSLRLSSDRRNVLWRNGGTERSAPID